MEFVNKIFYNIILSFTLPSCKNDYEFSLDLFDRLEILKEMDQIVKNQHGYKFIFKNNGATSWINIEENPRKYRKKSKKPKNLLCLTCPPLNRTERSNQIAKNQHLNEKIWNLFNWFFLFLRTLATKYVKNANNVRVVIFYDTKFSNNFKINWHRSNNPKFLLEETFIDMLKFLYHKFSFPSIFLENRFHRYNNHVLIQFFEKKKQLSERLRNKKNRRAKQNDVQELLEIKNKYEDVLKGKPMKNKQRSYTTSQYIRARCDSNDCLCYEQERELNNSFNNLPSEASQQDSVIIYERFNEQVLSWINSTYKCAPCLRSSCKIIATSDFLYIFGGSNPSISEKALRDVYRFNILTRKWKKLKVANLPTSLISFAICWDPNPIGDHLIGYLFGGAKDPDGYEISDELFKFQIDSEGSISFQNVEIDKLARPTPRCGCSMVMAHGKLYLIGGVDYKSYLSDVWVLDVHEEKLKWRELKTSNMYANRLMNYFGLSKSQPNSQIVEKDSEASAPLRGRYTHELVLIDDLILIIGGGDEEWTITLDKIDAFDIKREIFIKIETLPDKHHGYPDARKYFSVVKDGKDIYIIGGWLDNDGITRKGITDEEDVILFDDIWKLSQITVNGETYYIWTKLPTKLKLPLFFHASAITPEGCIYTFGGCIDAKSMYPSNKLQRFWIKPPELRQISMFKMVVNNPHLIEDFEKKEVMELNNKVLNTYSRSSSQEIVNVNSTEWMEDNVHELLQTRPNRLIQLLWQ